MCHYYYNSFPFPKLKWKFEVQFRGPIYARRNDGKCTTMTSKYVTNTICL